RQSRVVFRHARVLARRVRARTGRAVDHARDRRCAVAVLVSRGCDPGDPGLRTGGPVRATSVLANAHFLLKSHRPTTHSRMPPTLIMLSLSLKNATPTASSTSAAVDWMMICARLTANPRRYSIRKARSRNTTTAPNASAVQLSWPNPTRSAADPGRATYTTANAAVTTA